MRHFITSAAVVASIALGACDKKPAETTTTSTATTAPTSGATKDWLKVIAATPEGGFLVGNPDAKVKLVEYASLTCPHCKVFHDESDATLRSKYIASGNVSYEYRNFLLNGPDMAASLLARCDGAATFFNLMNAFYDTQTQWTEPFAKLTPAESARLGALPQDQQLAALAKTGGLDTFMRARGMTSEKFDKCLSDQAATKRLTDMRDAAVSRYQLNGTPGFLINDVVQKDILTWATLEPKLQAALS